MNVSYDDGKTWLDMPPAFVEELIENGERADVLVDISGRGSKGFRKPWRLEQLRRKRAEWQRTNK